MAPDGSGGGFDRVALSRALWPGTSPASFPCESVLLQSDFERVSRASAGVPREVGPHYALGRQLYAPRRCGGTNTYKLSGSSETALEGRLLRS